MMQSHPLLQHLVQLGVTPTRLVSDSRRVKPGDAFVAFPGETADGRDFIKQAVANGASAVLWEAQDYRWDDRLSVPQLPVAGLSAQLGEIASAFYGEPAKNLWVVGITGTNGKTSCSHWLARAMNHLGRKSAIIGTLGNGFPEALSETLNTTPDPISLQELLATYLAQHATSVVMEVSSHGLELGRVNGMKFDVAVFTNLSRDHLDFHGDMASYAASKRALFAWPELKHAVINADDTYGSELAQFTRQRGIHTVTYGFGAADIRGSELKLSGHGLSMQVTTPSGTALLQAEVMGKFNASNLLAVLASLLVSGVPLADAINTLSQTKPVTGRMQTIGGGDLPLVIVDYAHTPDALEKVLGDLREQCQHRLICVFGCGGNRDKGKRPLMAKAAAQLADYVVITSDNPRNEAAQDIIADILTGMPTHDANYLIETDRAVAIRKAIHMATAGDVVLLAGKGHENTQQIGATKYPFSDAAVAAEIIHAAKACA